MIRFSFIACPRDTCTRKEKKKKRGAQQDKNITEILLPWI